MDNHIESLLVHWLKHKDKCQWVLATIIETQGSAYRKAGAMMLINDLGQYVGLVSGGCLESDVMRHAIECLTTGENKTITYDMQDDSDISWQLGIGCGGMVKILLQPINQSNNFLSLKQVHQQLSAGYPASYCINYTTKQPNNYLCDGDITCQESQLQFELKPRIRIAVFGAGADAIPVVNMARSLSWHVTVVDPRPSYARASLFKEASVIIKDPINTLVDSPALEKVDVAIIMTHNLTLDAQALRLVQQLNCQYSGLLGPKHRTEKLMKIAGINASEIRVPLFNPIGFDIGGELPESIALSMLSQAHAFMYGKIDINVAGNVLNMSEYISAI